MPAADVLKTLRGSQYNKTSQATDDSNPEKDAADESSDTTRLIKLTDEEQKSISANPGETVTCEVQGTLDGEGMFRVMSIEPSGVENDDEKAMAGQVAQRVMPNIVPSPS